MVLSKEYQVNEYRTFPEAVPYNVIVGPRAYYFSFNVTLMPEESLRLTVATALDLGAPTIGAHNMNIIPLGPKYSVKLQPEIIDIGWGVENATLMYLVGGATEWEAVSMTRGLDNTFEAKISGILNNETVSYRIVAYDYAGHKAEAETQTISSQQTTTSATTTSLSTTHTTPVKTTTTVAPTTVTQTSSATPSTSATTQTSIQPTTSTPSTTIQMTSSAPSTTEGPPAATTAILFVVVIVVVTVVLAAALMIRRRSSQPSEP